MLPQIILAITKIDTLRSTMQVLRTLWVIAIASREEWRVYGSVAVLITLIEVLGLGFRVIKVLRTTLVTGPHPSRDLN